MSLWPKHFHQTRLPLPPGCFPTLWPNDEEKYHSSYFQTYPGYYRCGTAHARTHDTLAVA
jgi:propionyl-CoA synthetase